MATNDVILTSLDNEICATVLRHSFIDVLKYTVIPLYVLHNDLRYKGPYFVSTFEHFQYKSSTKIGKVPNSYVVVHSGKVSSI